VNQLLIEEVQGLFDRPFSMESGSTGRDPRTPGFGPFTFTVTSPVKRAAQGPVVGLLVRAYESVPDGFAEFSMVEKLEAMARWDFLKGVPALKEAIAQHLAEFPALKAGSWHLRAAHTGYDNGTFIARIRLSGFVPGMPDELARAAWLYEDIALDDVKSDPPHADPHTP